MKTVLLVISIFLVNSVYSQTDTVAYPDPWYLYRPTPVCPDVWHLERTMNYRNYTIESFHTEQPVEIYGIACVIDTFRSDQGNPDYCYHPMLYRYEGIGPINGLNYRYFSVVDSLSFYHHIRQCKFKYAYSSLTGDNQPNEEVYNCYEYYFTHPYRSDTINTVPGYQDSVYVGTNIPCLDDFGAWTKIIYLYDYVGYASGGLFHGENEHSNHVAFQPDLAGRWSKIWGPYFPIVRLRCVQPELRLGRNWYDTTVVSWRTVEAPDGYELSLGDYGSDPDDGTIVALPDSCHSYAFPRLLSNHHYSVWVRKGCAYPNFDTVAWSPWSDPVSFFGPTAPPNPGDTTAIDKVPTPQAFTLSPNPASGTVTVSADFALQRVDLYNTAGALVLSLPANGTSMEISLEGLLPGTYVVAVATAAGTATRKLTVER